MKFKIILLSTILFIVDCLPIHEDIKLDQPFWHMPCGEFTEVSNENNLVNEFEVSLNYENLKLQHQLTLTDYLNRDYGFLYERVRIGVHEHQYIPNWIPGKMESHSIRKLAGKPIDSIIQQLPRFHEHLQKFAVAVEEIMEDEISPRIVTALNETKRYLTLLLCEVESNIAVQPHMNLPARVERTIMSKIEREPVDDTRRLVRDWGVLLKYKDYLHAWRHVFNY